ncbi:transcriptional regulator, AraC family [Ekhidna lutea]|uniref:Transcriptional regulator, AraC family n=1 Tax=Ekhidna lutea TaxID=447679 RepID=A0A239KML0_EKHLU|nr:helix-turn-helix domain-containing protein [Ekhidna lutea]SNT19637.1 transcriptional regulator, AraC family [Ekhidna lutea]
MEDYNKIIESLEIRFVKARNINILKPVTIDNNYEVENYLILVTGGEIKFGKEKETATEGDVIFVPGGRPISMTYGSGSATILSKDDFLTNKDQFLKSFGEHSLSTEHYSYVAFDAKAFDSVNFFSSLDIPPFKIEENYKLAGLIKQINDEVKASMPGRDRIVKVLTENMTIELIRYILNNSLFVEKLATNSTYFKDPRLIDIFTFIKENLSDDLSNKVLANVANVSEDYVGQYFKMLTGINPQDYIEYQRMEAAVNLLRTSKKSIRDIGKEVGYKDTAYFCRRFKMMFGIPAGKMRRRESLMNV